MIRFLTIILLLVISLGSKSQNLVPNPSFEDTVSPNGFCIGHLGWTLNWFNPTSTSPDLYTYDPLSSNCITSSMNNPSGYQLPRTGNTYLGIYTHVGGGTREYLAIELDSILTQGCQYYIEFYVSQADNFGLATDKIGCAFSFDTTGYYSYTGNIPLPTAIESPAGLLLTDTLNWVKVSGYYLANGSERFCLIGNFYNDANTLIDTSHSATYYSAYYYIDDVSVISCDSLTGFYAPNSKSSIQISPNPFRDHLQIHSSTDLTGAEFIMYDVLGKEVFRSIIGREKQISITRDNITSGLYFYQLVEENRVLNSGKLVAR